MMKQIGLIAMFAALCKIPVAFGAGGTMSGPLKDSSCNLKKLSGTYQAISIKCLDSEGKGVENTSPPDTAYISIDGDVIKVSFFRDGAETSSGTLTLQTRKKSACLTAAEPRDALDSLNGLPTVYGEIGIDSKSGELLWNIRPTVMKMCRGNQEQTAYQVLHLKKLIAE